MKSIKILMMVVLLTAGSHVFATIDKYLEQTYNEFKKDVKNIIDERKHLRKNGTPLEKASIQTTDLALSAVSLAFNVGASSYLVDSILESFDITKDIENRGTIATGGCALLFTILYASYSYQEMQKSEDNKNSFYDWLSSFVK